MPLYYFVLKAGRHSYPDSEGQEFDNDTAARSHAHAVARELMRNRETRTAHWRVQVCDDYLQPRFEYLFADVDNTLERFDDEFRVSVKAAARTTAAIGDSLRQIDTAMADLRDTISQIDSIIASRPSA
jgi:hypothetical protein